MTSDPPPVVMTRDMAEQLALEPRVLAAYERAGQLVIVDYQGGIKA